MAVNESKISFGDQVYQIVFYATGSLFTQNELADLTYRTFQFAANAIARDKSVQFEMPFPVGYSSSKKAIMGSRTYNKKELINLYKTLAESQLPINVIYQFVATIETMLGNLIQAIIIKYPEKLSSKMTLDMRAILEASSMEEIHRHAAEMILHDLSYKSPRDFAQEAKKYRTSIIC